MKVKDIAKDIKNINDTLIKERGIEIITDELPEMEAEGLYPQYKSVAEIEYERIRQMEEQYKSSITGESYPKFTTTTAESEPNIVQVAQHLDGTYSYRGVDPTSIFKVRHQYTSANLSDDEEEEIPRLKNSINSRGNGDTTGEDSVATFLANRNTQNLFKMLFKTNVISRNHSALTFYAGTMSAAKTSTHVRQRIERDMILIDDNLNMYGIRLTEEEFIEVKGLLSRLYNLNENKSFFFYINDRDSYHDIVHTCIKKGILMEDEFKSLNTLDFKFMRVNRLAIYAFYSPVIGELIVLSKNYHQPLIDNTLGRFETFTNTLPSVDINSSIDKDTIEINGKEYSKSVFESIVETGFDNFIENLEVETILSNIVEEPVKPL